VKVEVFGSIDQALRALKRKLNREGIFGALKRRARYVNGRSPLLIRQ
jgi:ribosomal protein S21